MARVAITEYAAKRLCFGEAYQGQTATAATINEAAQGLSEGTYVVKVDVGIKKRGKQGLLAVNVPKNKVISEAQALFALGHARVVIEPFVAHKEADERYISLELIREGVRVLYSDAGGVAIEEHGETVVSQTIPLAEVLAAETSLTVATVPMTSLLSAMREYHLSFIEINPYLALNKDFIALDMAAEIDSVKEHQLPEWAQEHVLHKQAVSAAEAAVLEQDARTQAALNLHTLNENGSILTLFSGGGASLVALDSLVTAGLSDDVINYSEYSGAPTRDETAQYVATLLTILFASTAKNKVILIAGGVANFTDVRATFEGIVDALTPVVDVLQKQGVYVCVRRGGPNQDYGLAHLASFLTTNNIQHDVHGPILSLGKVGELVKQHI